jgi:hypothetical protein
MTVIPASPAVVVGTVHARRHAPREAFEREVAGLFGALPVPWVNGDPDATCAMFAGQ